MKVKKYGCTNYSGEVFTRDVARFLFLDTFVERFYDKRSALENYRKERENGVSEDNPKQKFPYDGTFKLDSETRMFCKIYIYTEGP